MTGESSEIPTTLAGHYRIESEIGRGGMAVVYGEARIRPVWTGLLVTVLPQPFAADPPPEITMREALTRALWRSAVAVSIPFVFAVSVEAQVSLEAKLQGTDWGTSLSLSSLQDMGFRWSYASGSITSAAWQLTYTAPSSETSPIVKSVPVAVPEKPGWHTLFTITPSMIPADHPSKFWLRVRTTGGFSPWIPVSISQRRASQPSGDLVGALNDPVRAEPTLPPAPVPPAPITAPFPTDLSIPLWLKLTKIVAEKSTDDGNPDDEIYAIVSTIAVDRSNPKASKVSTRYTRIFEGVNDGEGRTTDLAAWSPVSGEAMPISDPGDIIVLATVMENDGAVNRALAAQLITAGILGKLGNMTSSTNRSFMITAMYEATFEVVDKMLAHFSNTQVQGPTPSDPQSPSFGIGAGDDMIGGVAKNLVITFDDLSQARQGKIVKKTLTFEGGGKYHLRFQLGRRGKTTVSW